MKRRLDLPQLHGLLEMVAMLGVDFAVLEDVGGLPGQSASAAFNFGRGCGHIEALLVVLGIPIRFAHPAVWKRAMRVPRDKDAARAYATREFPADAHQWPLVKDDGKAEAALLALYGIRTNTLPAADARA